MQDIKINDKSPHCSKHVLANRIFKLRAWVRNELMVNVVSIDFNNEFITWDDNQYDRCVPPNKCYEIETFDDIVLMQFTNFKDKKGNDIYEGDILELNNCGLLIVCFYKGEFKLQKLAEYHKKRNIYASISYLEFSLLRGNIYENIKLLTI